MVILGVREPLTVGEGDIRQWREWIAERSDNGMAGVAEARSRGPIASWMPAYSALQMDPHGNVWIGEHTLPEDDTRRWTIVSQDGAVSTVELPTVFEGFTYRRPDLLAVGHGMIAILLRDEWNEERVEVWEVGSG